MELKAGEKLWNGTVISEALAKAYNDLNKRIVSFEKAGLTAPEHLLNGRHNLINNSK